MTPASLLASATSLIAGNPDAVGLIDRCTVYNRTYTSDSAGGATYSDSAVASNVPCLYEERLHNSTILVGGTTTEVSHNLYLIGSAATRAIKPSQIIVVAARGDTGALTFENPIRLDESLSPIVHLAAMLKP